MNEKGIRGTVPQQASYTLTTLALGLTLLSFTPSSEAGLTTEQKPVQDPQNPSQKLDPAIIERNAKLRLKFGGRSMNDERAKSIADAAGFTYISWNTCAGAPGCAVFEVQGKKGAIYRYIVSEERCKPIGKERAGVGDPASIVSGAARTGRHAESNPTNPKSPSALPTPISEDDEPATPKNCFSQYTSLLRARQHNVFSIDHRSYTFKLEERYQAIVAERWEEVLTSIVGAWEQPSSGGMTQRGTTYEWLDAAGNSLKQDSQVIEWIESSGSGPTPTVEQTCRSERDKVKARWTLAAEAGLTAVCAAIPLPTQISASFGGVSASKSLDYCASNRNTALAAIEVAAAATYDDCIKNPGRYDPAHHTPVPGKYSLEGYLGFEPMIAEVITFEGNCPMTRTNKVTTDLGGGWICTTTSKYFCAKDSDNNCSCKKAGEDEQVCTQG